MFSYDLLRKRNLTYKGGENEKTNSSTYIG